MYQSLGRVSSAAADAARALSGAARNRAGHAGRIRRHDAGARPRDDEFFMRSKVELIRP
jgi:hypothetical protein